MNLTAIESEISASSLFHISSRYFVFKWILPFHDRIRGERSLEDSIRLDTVAAKWMALILARTNPHALNEVARSWQPRKEV